MDTSMGAVPVALRTDETAWLVQAHLATHRVELTLGYLQIVAQRPQGLDRERAKVANAVAMLRGTKEAGQ